MRLEKIVILVEAEHSPKMASLGISQATLSYVVKPCIEHWAMHQITSEHFCGCWNNYAYFKTLPRKISIFRFAHHFTLRSLSLVHYAWLQPFLCTKKDLSNTAQNLGKTYPVQTKCGTLENFELKVPKVNGLWNNFLKWNLMLWPKTKPRPPPSHFPEKGTFSN